MRVSSQYRVDAPLEWVRDFLVRGTADEDRTVEGDTVVVRQHDTFLHLVVENRLAPEGDVTLLDIDADVRLRGLGWLAGTLFRRRLRRTLVKSLDGLPAAIEVALEQAEHHAALDGYSGGTVDGDHTGGAAVTERIRHDADAATVSEESKNEDDPRVPQTTRETVRKAGDEAGGAEGPIDAVKRAAREVDRTFSGEYEAREDRAQAERAEDEAGTQ